MNLLQDMMPDWDWAKRGGLERHGLVLTALRSLLAPDFFYWTALFERLLRGRVLV
jgi:hypothetical protein